MPTGTADPIVTGDAGFLSNLDTFISNDSCLKGKRGTIIGRNACTTGWINILSLRLQQEIKVGDSAFDVFLDIENFGNMINDDWGRVDAYSAPSNVALTNASIEGGQYLYEPVSSAQDSPETMAPKPAIARLPSVYRIQFGLKFRF